ncbi:protein phosphatase 2C domain-containing protein [Corynebacterium sp.]|uniref:PP2C family protein-serine/threonine phosphatase n=1 Tax=Corynebacterium sp. TaxID=1720 RepID=UPI0028ABEFA6|nr:protein phosphatase 2C domain-containing protein [Corynebacterium sp.]
MLKLNFTAASDRGLVRGNNEDSAYAGPYLLALADGMGGHAAGEVASQLMITHLMGLDKNPGDNDMLALLGTVSTEANWSISEHIKQHPETDGMGTTLTSMMFNGSQFAVCHAGDSRGYLLRDNKLQQVTKDDTYVQSLVDEGKLDPEDVTSHPQKSLILKAYNGRDVEPTLFLFDAQPGDRILLCSDGLSDPVTASTIETALAAGPIEEVASRLVELALRSGGPDNVTVVLADVVEATEEEIAAAKEQGISNPADADTSKFAATAGISEEQAAGEKAASINPQAILVGAIAGEVPEPTHPDSAASRAAALNRRPQVIEPYSGPTTAKGAPRATLSPTGGNPTNPVNGDSGAAGSADGSSEGATDPADEEPRRPRRRFFGWPLIVSIIVIIALVAGVWFVGKNYLNNNYYVAVADAATAGADAGDTGADEATAVEDASSAPSESADAEAAEVPVGQEITIKQGVDVELFGRSLNQPYQVACLREDGALQLAGASCPSGTQAFTLSDLPPSERSAVGNLEAGSYDEVQSQLTKLSERALPKCRESTTDKDKFRSTPGIDCREVN